MHYLIRGYDRQTGQPRMSTVEGKNEDDAIKSANIIVESIEPVAVMPMRTGLSQGDGHFRERYLTSLCWLCRIGGSLVMGWGIYAALTYYRTDHLEAVAFVAIAGMGAAIVACGELLAELPNLRKPEVDKAKAAE